MAVKICTHCRSKTTLDVERCPSCGGSEFWYKCANCGKIFDTPFCPGCGIKAGEQPKTCPKCGKQYFTASCPDCGWNPAHDDVERAILRQQYITTEPPQQDYYSHNNVPKHVYKAPSKASRNILLWILFLPIMGCIAIAKSQKLSRNWKIGLIAGIAVLCTVIVVPGRPGEYEPAKEASKAIPSVSPIADDLPTEKPTDAPAVIETASMPTQEPAIEPTIEPTSEPTPEPIQGYIDATSLNMRAEPNKESNIVQEYEGGQSVEIVGEDGDWYKVIIGGTVGYMLKDYVSSGEAPAATKGSTTQSEEKTDLPEEQAEREEPQMPSMQNYHGELYITPSGNCFHYEAECAGKNRKSTTWDVAKNYEPCGTCVLK